MPEKAVIHCQHINLVEMVNDNQTTQIREAVIVSMKAQEGRGTQEGFQQFGKEAWKKNIGDRSNLVARMLAVGAEKSDYSIWQACWENLPEADPERTLLSLDAPSRQWLLQLFQDSADEAWGKEKAHKVESEGFKKIGDKWEFDPERLQTDLFSVAEAAVGKMRELKLLPESFATQVKELRKRTTDQARAIELSQEIFGAAARAIEQWPDDMGLEVARERLEGFSEAAKAIFGRGVAIAEANFRAEGIPKLKVELIEKTIKPLPLPEQMAILMNDSGRFDRQIKVTTEGQPCSLFTLMFPEISGLDPIAKISRAPDGNLSLALNAMFPDKKGTSKGRINLFQQPLVVDGQGILKSTLKGVGENWSKLSDQAKNWFKANMVDERSFTDRLTNLHHYLAIELSKFLGARRAFLKDGSLKFVWDKNNNLFTISAERDNRSGGPGR